MKNYLELIPISAKVRRRQNRLTIWCIIISVFLVTAIFSISDMFYRKENDSLQDKHGSWHLELQGLSEEVAEEIGSRPDVEEWGFAKSYNTDGEQSYFLEEKKAALYGADGNYLSKLTGSVTEGTFPENDASVMLSENAREVLQVEIGAEVVLHTPVKDYTFTVCGFGSDDKDSYENQTYVIAVYLTLPAFEQILKDNGVSLNFNLYLRFQTASAASQAEEEIQAQYQVLEGSIQENKAVMGMAGQSSNASIRGIYGLAAALFVLVLVAGSLMIAGSMNSNVAQRTKFFGMMRCIGASRRQILHFVRLEALNWCKTAVPVGLLAGTLGSWTVCGVLRYCIGGEWESMPVWKISPVGLVSGAVVGIATVLLAAQSPAKRAAKVSPMAAVSGNLQIENRRLHALKEKSGRIEFLLGIQHAASSRKNWLLMTASFALSIMLFLMFSVGLDFGRALMPSLRAWQPDMTLNGYANATVLPEELLQKIQKIPGVRQAYGCSYLEHVPASSNKGNVDYVNLTAYSDTMMQLAEQSVVEGSFADIQGDTCQVMTVLNKDNPLRLGDKIQVGDRELEITGVISEGVFPSAYSVVCSVETFARLTGKTGYSLVGVQLDKTAPKETAAKISSLAGTDVIYSDLREYNQETRSTYLAICLICYSFLGIIGIIALFHIVNSISMNVTARMRQFGIMRAVGMDNRQLGKMIAVEAFTYGISGLVSGCAIGLLLNKWLYERLLTRYFGMVWKVPVSLLGISVVFVIVASAAAVYAPVRRIRNMVITQTINEL